MCIRRAFRRGTSVTIILQTNWSDFLFYHFILPRWCTSTFFAVFNEARTYISVKTLRRYIKGIFIQLYIHLSPAYKAAIVLLWRL